MAKGYLGDRVRRTTLQVNGHISDEFGREHTVLSLPKRVGRGRGEGAALGAFEQTEYSGYVFGEDVLGGAGWRERELWWWPRQGVEQCSLVRVSGPGGAGGAGEASAGIGQVGG